MPTIGEFDGIRVMMFHRDHLPPHFHVEYGDDEAEIAIATLEVLAGQVPPATVWKVREWAVFGTVSVGRRGRFLEWPGELDFCADALWFEAHPQDNPYSQQHSAAE